MTGPLLADYSGAFEPDFRLERLAPAGLARVGRELMLFAHFHDRGLMPLVAARFGREHMTALACDEWMGASPVYNARARELLGIRGDGVSAIFKALQVDPGFAHRYMDVGYELVDEALGYFWLRFCGAYQDVHKISRGSEPAIRQLCHAMEDPTFDATAIAVNPRARVRPEHRPPLALGHTGPVCRWRVFLDDSAAPYPPLPVREKVAASRAARFRFAELPGELGPGLADYSGAFVPDFSIELLARPVLARLCREWMLDVHLLTRAAAESLRARWGAEVARELAREQWAALAPVYVPRLRRALGIAGDDMASVLKTLQADPALPHEYVRSGAVLESPLRGRFWIEPCDAFADGEPEGWLALLLDGSQPGFDAVVAAVNPRARCIPTSALSWRIEIDPEAEPRPEAPMANAVRVSNVARFELER
ncbi:MAG TPA: hypothetical protein VEN47_07675 [Myxococcota bacterium]|nr:hypothetical protein [Myxococcota bacterium]